MPAAPTVADALAGARYRAPSDAGRKTVLVAGAANRLGERVVTRVLATSEYQRIYVLACNSMPSTEPKLVALMQAEWACRVDHVIAVVGAPVVAGAMPHRKRTDIFAALTLDEVLPLARQAKELGVKRFMLVTPTDVLGQPSAVYAQLANAMEFELHQMDFESLLIVRPSDYELRRRQSGFAMRMMALVADTARGLLNGLRHTPLTQEDTARAIVHALLDSAQGLHIIETDGLHRFPMR